MTESDRPDSRPAATLRPPHRFATGFRPDKVKAYFSHHMMMSAAPLLSSSDLTPFRGAQIRQKYVGECVGAGFLRRPVQIWHAIRNLAQPDASEFGAYNLGMANEYAGLDPDSRPPLRDVGSMPETLLAAARDVGILLASDWPGPGDPGFDPAKAFTNWGKGDAALILAELAPDLLVKAFDCTGLDFFSVAWLPGQMRAECDAIMRRGETVGIAINADGIGANDPGAGVVTSLSPTGQNHAVTILDASHPEWARIENWWDDPEDGQAWGDQTSDPHLRGTWRVTWQALERGASNVLAVRGAPLIKKGG
jgi:hypothetical protein